MMTMPDLVAMRDETSPLVPHMDQPDDLRKVRPRGYQYEMLQESMKRNVIVAMDTGSGKTQVAIMRIEEELKHCDPDKLVWFLTPNVALCEQQHATLEAALPSYQHRILSGNDNVDKWSEKWLWDAVLKNIRVVVSTPQVLLDALSHGFVEMSRIPLLIFDEAHRCLKKTPMNQIMFYHYHPLKQAAGPKDQIPHILGLTASPIVRDDPAALHTLEVALDARTTTPKLNRTELATYVHQPQLLMVDVDTEVQQESPEILQRLGHLINNYNIMDDPYTIRLMQGEEYPTDEEILDLLSYKKKTYCLEQLKSLQTRSTEVQVQLGPFAADWYLRTCIARLRTSDGELQILNFGWTEREKTHLKTLLDGITVSSGSPISLATNIQGLLSEKVAKLLEILVLNSAPQFSGIVFVKQRATVAALTELISQHPETRTRFKVGSFVGTSSSRSRKSFVSDLADLRDQQTDLGMFRLQDRDLMIATSVLEEGIDVPSCQFVVCFDPPDNLVSYVQRRGRARQKESKYVIFVPQASVSISRFSDIEKRMVELYQDDLREAKAAGENEMIDETFERSMKVPSSGALLTMHNSLAHLNHFCQTLGASFTDLRPEFTIEKDPSTGQRSAQVILPNAVTQELRITKSREKWKTERVAIKDAAFESYAKLWREGLVNDHLLPVHLKKPEPRIIDFVESKPLNLTRVPEQLNPWVTIAETWSSITTINLFQANFELGDRSVTMYMILPIDVPTIERVVLHWNAQTSYTVSVRPVPGAQEIKCDPELLSIAREFTKLFLQPVFGLAVDEDREDFVMPFIRPTQLGGEGSLNSLFSGSNAASEALTAASEKDNMGLVRDRRRRGARYIYKGQSVTRPSRPDGGNGDDVAELCIEATKLPKRRDFLHKVSSAHVAMQPDYTTLSYLPIGSCTIDKFPASFSTLALFVPSIMHLLGIRMIADQLRTGLLRTVDIQDLDLVLEAICASSANEQKNYQRFEFLGDSVLKFCTTLHLMAAHRRWPESFLTEEKSRIVSNKTLAEAATMSGLARFVITKAFTGQKWRPAYIGELTYLAPSHKQRTLSTKTLADVVESLIGAAFIDGTLRPHDSTAYQDFSTRASEGLSKATGCLKALLPKVQWSGIDNPVSELFESIPTSVQLSPNFAELEALVGHRFANKSLLLSALTHPSFNADFSSDSYQRLEFLGDAVLDFIVTVHLFDRQDPPLTHAQLHTARESLVNGHFLSFLCSEWCNDQERMDAIEVKKNKFSAERKVVHHYLWQFMRHGSPEITQIRKETISRHQKLRAGISSTLQHGSRYPWVGLCSLQAPKFFSDIIESLLGAVYIDSRGSFAACERLLESMGLMAYLERVKRETATLRLVHPKEELGMLAGSDTVRYEFEDSDGELTCRIVIADKAMASITGGASKYELETKAAEQAIEVLQFGTTNVINEDEIELDDDDDDDGE